jgi:hypothetical protein
VGNKKQIIDLDEMGKQLDVPMVPYKLPDGRELSHPNWGKAHFNKAMEMLESYRKEPDTVLLVTKSHSPWLTMAIINGMKPMVAKYLYPNLDGEELEMVTLKRGTPENNYDVAFEIVEEGEKLFINMNSDRPDMKYDSPDAVPHTFEMKNLPKVMIPEIPSGKDVFIHAKGMFCVMVCVALNYITESKSVSIACHLTDYYCGYSSDPAREVGDVEVRTLENNL